MKLSFSLTNKSKPAGAAPPLKPPSAFASLDDDVDAAPTASADGKASVNKKLVAQNVGTSKATRKKMEQEQKLDSSVFEYDEVYEKMQEAKARQKLAKEAEAKERKPKYIAGLLQSAATRRLDHLRAEEKMIQREREMEGDEFKDKEAFVTQAYKDQLAEVRRAEEEEKRREEEEKKKNKGLTTGMVHFYRQLLEESEKEHEETIAAVNAEQTQKVAGPSMPNLTISKPADYVPKSDVELAKLASAEGKQVELNDDNQIVDKRELLSAGLNLSLPNTRRLGLKTSTSQKKDANGNDVQVHTAVGTAASRREIDERRRREVLKQMEEERERMAREKEQKEKEATARIAAKRNNEESVQSARERYLARKRQRLEQQSQSSPPPEGS
ncbi:hypothetical protein GLOTRDRAFT_57089 [Gloeophyllum trabeum ATCC 11539]|uniref:Nuclear speckle splicing regulatory protein 1 N-terminal domain-containing protein n=1 Tax=Gloeophyllum trabeum (strain ATCC 11539 / FP-39264 / Madison 617) TaxID=670483 RepID=S7RU72_GLOTA|nr:uncharacterized protein GLOTRDRAFT_57089 [Gloeophyllum trabeum ATCC 11539]EPQ58270.1 hypothetical protein GLOTRDRAFT_57089 [Gloeophyllum trabeum ATCC 11539]